MSYLIGLLAVFLVSNSPAETQVQFFKFGKLVRSIGLEELKKLSPVKNVTVFEPHEERDVTYLAISLTALLDAVYGKERQDTDEALFTCSDGFQASIATQTIGKFDSYLAIARKDSPFEVTYKDGGKRVELGPTYLIWDNLKNPELKSEGASRWPYQVKQIDLITFASRFPKLAPPGKHTDSVTHGFLHYREHCMACHTINGEGGAKGPELNYPVNVTEYFEHKFLVQWIENPANIRLGTTMPKLSEGLPNRNRVIRDIIAYLRSMKHRKIKPE